MTDSGRRELHRRVRDWIAIDPDPETRAEAESLLAAAEDGDAGASERLRDAFDGRLSFGTAGLRARLGAGPRRMNRVVVAQTSAGIAAFLRARPRTGGTVVVGHDARVNSEVFARDAAEILSGAGLDVTLVSGPVPTPILAFAVRHLDAAAGVMITASHNPPRDNGYKVFLGGPDAGAQVIPPVDREIADQVERAAALPFAALPRSDSYARTDESLRNAYVAATARSMLAAPQPAGSDPASTSDGSGAAGEPLRIAYTALHGVGAGIAERLFAAVGLPAFTSVPEQHRPDGRFPTVDYPNPEEPGSLDLAYRTAREIGAELVIANDPDADRLAVAVPDAGAPGGYRRLTGNELGLLLGWRAAERERSRALRTGEDPAGTLACTIVSSPSLRAVAADYGLDYAETLPGSKWLSRVPGLIFGYEEALGYLTQPAVLRDKDGIAAAAEAAAMARESGSLQGLLDEAGERFGHFASSQVVIRFDSEREAERIVERVRLDPPAAFDGVRVTGVRDFSERGLAPEPANVLAYDLENGSRVMLRPSGTEPKLKVYLDVFGDRGTATERRRAAAGALLPLERALRAYLEGLRS
ncbi:phospho-sugar mutase [Leucobacter weissii]|uniref:Phospho-sugar mutase n=1 Tax=Leucobacter weissii TaxID=1983706 RepID=A0A939SA90_9MICO|nr:phospho-sugar mutase [Leucobacter weissii]MBO1901692.1 phospho-sugar mutase [Leucobacter weissii]